MKKTSKNRSGKTVEQLAVSIFGKQKANEILNTTLTKKQLTEIKQDSIYTASEKADDLAIKAQIKKQIKGRAQ